MGYNQNLFAKVRSEFTDKRQSALRIAGEHRKELHDRCPEIVEIDNELAKTGLLIMEEIRKGKEGLEERLETIRLDNAELQGQRNQCMVFYGFPANYDTPHFDCPVCDDTGYVGTQMCDCLKRELNRQGMIRAGLGELFETQRFETFQLDYYSYDRRILQKMEQYKDIAMEFALYFPTQTYQNLLFCGGTGLGKTHLSTAIAGKVIERGYDVIYESAPNLLSAFEAERFGRSYNGTTPDTGRFFTCDLLVIDDLGAEFSNQFTLGCIYNLINTRLVGKKSMLISTNLTGDELRSRYSDRITSRLFGEFFIMRFEGKDVRMQKIGKK